MIIQNETELNGMKRVSEAVAVTLKKMREYARPGISTKSLDEMGASILEEYGARSAPLLTYKFPGHTCISVNKELAHGIPSDKTTLQEGDLINIDVSAELNGFWSDNGASFVVGEDIHGHTPLIETSVKILYAAISRIRGGVRINAIGAFIEEQAGKMGYRVIQNLGGHGVGKALHEPPHDILNYKDRFDQRRFRKNTVIALETFITTAPTLAVEQPDGFTLVGNKDGYTVQHEHTILITDTIPVILTGLNGIDTLLS